MTENPEPEKRQYFDVEKFRKIHETTSKRAGRIGRAYNRVSNVFDSMQGFFIALMGLPIMFGTLGAIVVGAYYGPLGFLLIMGSIIGGLALFVERKVGRSLQFGEYPLFRRALATPIAFLVALGFLYFLLTVLKFRGF